MSKKQDDKPVLLFWYTNEYANKPFNMKKTLKSIDDCNEVMLIVDRECLYEELIETMLAYNKNKKIYIIYVTEKLHQSYIYLDEICTDYIVSNNEKEWDDFLNNIT